MAASHEGAHAELLGERQGLAVVAPRPRSHRKRSAHSASARARRFQASSPRSCRARAPSMPRRAASAASLERPVSRYASLGKLRDAPSPDDSAPTATCVPPSTICARMVERFSLTMLAPSTARRPYGRPSTARPRMARMWAIPLQLSVIRPESCNRSATDNASRIWTSASSSSPRASQGAAEC